MPEVSVRDGVARSTQVTFSNPDFRTDGLQILAIEGDRMYAANNSFEEDGLVKFTEDALALTARGTSFVNTILADFL